MSRGALLLLGFSPLCWVVTRRPTQVLTQNMTGMSPTTRAGTTNRSRFRVDMRGRDGFGPVLSPTLAFLSAGASGMGCTAMLDFQPLAFTLFGLGVFDCRSSVRGSSVRRSDVRGSCGRSYFRRLFGYYIGRHFGRCCGRCCSGHFLFVEKCESPTVAQFPVSIQEKDGGESQ